MITIKNTQSDIKIDAKLLKKKAQYLLAALEYADFDLGILFCTNDQMQEYNKTYRGKDKPTDVLSFPYYPNLVAGERITAQSDDDKNIGDIIIATEYVQTDAPNWNQTFEQRIDVLLIHGICHLLGYDHEIDEDYEIMKAQEEWLLEKLRASNL